MSDLTYKANSDCPYIHASEDVKSAWADGWNQCAQLAKGLPALECNENAYATEHHEQSWQRGYTSGYNDGVRDA